MAINEVKVNGQVALTTRGDTVSPDNLATGETAHNRAGEPIVGQMGGDSDAYRITDPIGNIDNNDYIPFNDVSDPQQPKKKTPLSALLEKLGKAFLPSKGDRFDLNTASDTVDYQSTDIDGAFGDNNVTGMRYPSTLNILDRMKRIIMRTEAVVNPNGKIGWKAYVKNYDTDGNTVGQKGMQFHMDKSGNLEYTIDDFNAFRAAIQTVDQLGTEIPADSDLDDYMTAGTYRVTDDATAATIDNLPLPLCGKIVVLDNGNGGLEQVYFPNHEPRILVRSYWNSSWGDWKEIDIKTVGAVYALIDGSNISDPNTFRKNIKTIDQLGTEIPANSDLNTYTTCGTYQCVSDTNAKTMSNLPYTGNDRYGFKLIVVALRNSTNIMQMYIPYSNVNHLFQLNMAYRTTNDNGTTWNNWTHIANADSVHYLSQPDLAYQITANQNLNDFTTEGTYQCNNGNIAVTLSNCPVKCSFKLIVDRAYTRNESELTQRITCQNATNVLDWYRSKQYNSSTWGRWIQSPRTIPTTYTRDGSDVYGMEWDGLDSNGSRAIIKFNQDYQHLRHNFYDGTAWTGEKEVANFEDIYLYSQYLREVMGISGRRIYRTDDLDNFTDAGTYQYSYDANGLPANTPNIGDGSIRSFKLIVDRYSADSRSEILQRITMINKSGMLDWYRTREWNSSTWGAWKNLASKDDIPEISPSAIGNGYAVGTVNGSAITATITGFKLQAGVIVSLLINNSLPTNATLNISSTGAKFIYVRNRALQSCDFIENTPNCVYTFMYDGTYYRILSHSSLPSVREQSYTADTSGNIVLTWGSQTNASQIKFAVASGRLLHNYYKNSAWRGDKAIVDVTGGLTMEGWLGLKVNGGRSIASGAHSLAVQDTIPNIINELRYSNGCYGSFNLGNAYTNRNCTIPAGWYNYLYIPHRVGGQDWATPTDWDADNVNYGTLMLFGMNNTNGMFRIRYSSESIVEVEDLQKGNIYVGTCTTAAATKDKEATVDGNFVLRKGVRVAIKFTNTNTYNSQTSSPVTLNVNSTGAKNIWGWSTHSGAGNTGTNATFYGYANRYINYYYDGTYWVWDGQSGDNDSDIRPSAYCDTAAGTAAKTAVCTNYSLLSNSYLHVLIRYANTSAGALTLNVNGQGAKPIYINGAASSASNYTLPAGTYLVYYNGTNYYFRTDGNMQTNNNIVSIFDNTSLFPNNNYVSGTSGWYGLNIHPSTDKNDMATLKVYAPNGRFTYNYKINGAWKGDGDIFCKWFPNVAYCTSSTEAATAAKVATTQGGGKIVYLYAGLIVCVVHSVNNTASNCTLNIDDTGAKQIYYNQGVFTGSTDWICGRANMAIYYMYDGTYWRWMNMGRMDNSTGFVPNNNNGTITVNSSSPYLALKSSIIDIKESNNGVTGTSYPAYIIEDKNNYNMSRLETVVETNGNISTYLQVRNYKTADGTTPNGGIKVTMDKEANVTYSLTNPHKFNAALGTGYGTCDTAADQQVKVVTLANFVLSVGAKVCVKFTNTNSFNSQTSTPVQLNVNNTGAKNIWYNTTHSGAGNTGTNTRIYGEAGRIFTYMFDGTYWVWLGCGYEADTVDPRVIGIGYGTCNTAAATAAKVVTLSSYTLRTGGYVTVKFDYDVPANATMNINSRGAKNIYYRGVAITAGLIRGGDRATFIYNGSQYDLIGIDRDSVTCELTQTLAANATTVTFTGLPTSGNVIYDVYTSKAGLNYKSMDDSTSGQLKITFDAQSAAVTVYLRYQWIG